MSEEGGKMNRDAQATAAASGEPLPANYYYGTFQGVANYQTPPSQSQPVFGIPQPIPPPGVSPVPPCYYPHGYQTVQGFDFGKGVLRRNDRILELIIGFK
ncbi:hypothetical protein HAX54_036903 [Datura stramonium]|uniref:Uncharacterized protein n=1 Tax=Datura stramonium TaxID=4076 RepID=A0ABS8VIV3_DATST|nr:hypothetical protein [Datura stramonium]